MLRHYLHTAARTLHRHPTYAIISVLGLAVSLAGALLIGRYVAYAFSYDDHWPNADHIVRLVANEQTPEGARRLAVAPLKWGTALQQERPEVKRVLRLEPDQGWVSYGDSTVQKGQGQNLDDGTHLRGTLLQADILYADRNILDVFDLKLQRGDPETVLTTPYDILLTEDFAREQFGDANPVGTMFKLGDRIRGFEVVGVVESIPDNSHFGADLLLPHSDWLRQRSDWTSIHRVYTYLELRSEAAVAPLRDALPAFLDRHLGSRSAQRFEAALQPITSIHLRSDRAFEMQPGGNRQAVLLFAGIAGLILLVAGVNFVNLATARAVDRQAEVGVRKAIGARRRDLIGQFLGEAALVSTAALAVAVTLASAALPAFNALAGTSLTLMGGVGVWKGGLGGLGLLVMLTLLAGGYPAWALSRFGPREALAGSAIGGTAAGRRSWLRSGLVVFQFATAVVLVISTAVAYQQVDFLQTRPLGYDKEQIVTLPNRDHGLTNDITGTEQVLSRSAAVERVGAVALLPGSRIPERAFRRPETRQSAPLHLLRADTAFASVMGLNLKAGRWLRAPRATAQGLEVVLNTTAATRLGFASPEAAIGTPLEHLHPEADTVAATGRIVGVVEDFHWSALRDRLQPMAIVPARSKYDLQHYVARLAPGATAAGVTALTTAWKARSNYPQTFRYSFLSDDWAALYRGEQQLQRIVGVFAGLAVVIACLGLFGLATYVARRRIKEVGIRKALGATVLSIIALLSRDFLKLVGAACALAIPVAYLGAQWWLQDYAYHVTPSPAVFALAVGGTLLLALATVSQQAWRAARTEPAEVLRSE